jgi:ABC-2 type transport system permease protein
MPGWLQPFAINQPVSQCAKAVRGLMLGRPHGASTWITLAWSIGTIAILAPLATAQYRKVA